MSTINTKKPFAIIKRKVDQEAIILEGEIEFLNKLSEIPHNTNHKKENNSDQYETISAIPFSQIKEKGFQAHDQDKLLISCLKIKKQKNIKIEELLKILPNEKLEITKINYNYSKKEYAEMVKTIIKKEIGDGQGANFLTPRTGTTEIKNMTTNKALNIFKNLLKQEIGSHWTFIFYDGEKYLIGASPEAHIVIKNQRIKMHPISGTFRKKGLNNIKEFRQKFIKFLENPKEINELFMVVDEELKMMADICDEGGMIIGPLLKEMSYLIHTEYLLSGKSKKNIIDILRKSMFAATVIGGPLETACRIVKKYEKYDRRFYSSCLALIGKDENQNDFLDSTILIRTVEINKNGQASFSAGATLVRNSDPIEEAEETEAKIEALYRSLFKSDLQPPIPIMTHLEEDDEVLETLARRNQHLSRFWFFNQEEEENEIPKIKNKKITIINNEDDFVYMTKHVLSSLGAEIQIIKYKDYDFNQDKSDLTIIGPGTGNPNDKTDQKMLKLTKITQQLLNSKKKFIGICLGHQFVCKNLNIELIKRENPFQGTQEIIKYFDKKERVGFYNTFVGKYKKNIPDVEISYDLDNKEINALRNKNFESIQFHPESILTQNGKEIFAKILERLL